MDKKYYFVKSKRLADAIVWVSGLTYLTYDDRVYVGQKIFSFEDTPLLREVLTDLSDLQKKYKK